MYLQGSYSVTLDDSLPQPASSATAKVDQFDSLLFAASSLDTLREHRVVLKNVSGPSQDSPIDIDYMLITAGNGDNQCAHDFESRVTMHVADFRR